VPTEHRKRGPRAPGRPSKSGARALARHLAAGSLDGRSWVARALNDIQEDLATDRGCFRSPRYHGDDAETAPEAADG
jgi:hypothetical protein